MLNIDTGAASKYSDANALRELIIGMRLAYARGENVMNYVRERKSSGVNSPVSTLVAYDLQAGTYVSNVRSNPSYNASWCQQLAGILEPLLLEHSSILEVGCGEATTLAGVLPRLAPRKIRGSGFDISWSRVAQGNAWLEEQSVSARLYVADLFGIPLEDSSIDIVYTSHSLEPNGGREKAAIQELLRIARRAVVLVEPIYELADDAAKERMAQHGYVRGLKDAAMDLGAKVADYRLLEISGNPRNPSGVIVLDKTAAAPSNLGNAPPGDRAAWRCPLTHTSLIERRDVFISTEAGLVYPVLRGTPMLRSQHAIVASGITLESD